MGRNRTKSERNRTFIQTARDKNPKQLLQMARVKINFLSENLIILLILLLSIINGNANTNEETSGNCGVRKERILDRTNGLGTSKVTSNDTPETHLHNYEINCTGLRGKSNPSFGPSNHRGSSPGSAAFICAKISSSHLGSPHGSVFCYLFLG